MSERDFDKISDVRVGELILSPDDLQKVFKTKRGDCIMKFDGNDHFWCYLIFFEPQSNENGSSGKRS